MFNLINGAKGSMAQCFDMLESVLRLLIPVMSRGNGIRLVIWNFVGPLLAFLYLAIDLLNSITFRRDTSSLPSMI
jgi:hypothetical protein